MTEMGSLEISNKTLDKYFGYLSRLNNSTKKRLIIKLTKSLELKPERKFDLKTLFGAWEDDKDSDKILMEIRKSRIEPNNRESF